MEKQFMKICEKAEKNKKLNPNRINYDCETIINMLNTKKNIKIIIAIFCF